MNRCECTETISGLRCRALALWIVSVGMRKADSQASCGTHLSRTCALMLGAESRPGAALTVRTAARRQDGDAVKGNHPSPHAGLTELNEAMYIYRIPGG